MYYRFIMRIPECADRHAPGWWLFCWPLEEDCSQALEYGPFPSLAEAEEFRDRTVH